MSPYTITRKIHVHIGRYGRRGVRSGPTPPRPPARTPRISKLMALAIHFDDMVTHHQLEDYATLARLGQLSRTRISQIINLARLAPDIQEEILFLPKTTKERDCLNTTVLGPLADEPDWERQRTMWMKLKKKLPQHVLFGDNDTEDAAPTQG
jgi:hypothetical protein